MNKYIFITQESAALPIADRLIDEGKEVVVGMVEKEDDPDTSKDKTEKRLSLYDGILEKRPVDEVLKWMEKLPDKDEWFVMFDYGSLWEYSEQAMKMGFKKGIFPTEEGYELEKDRQIGKAFAQEHYPDLKVAPVNEFSKVDEAIKFLEEQGHEHIFVLKSEGSNAETVVPLTNDFDLARRQITGALITEIHNYERGGFTLEEKIRAPIELSPVMVFWDGKPLFSVVELENKPFGSSNIGRLTGGCQNLTIQTPLDCKLNGMAFPPVIYEMAKKQPGIGIYDAGLLFDGKDYYFTEFCSNRWGWDGIFSEIAMCADENDEFATSRHFDLIAEGKNPLRYNYGAAVRLFQTEPSSKFADCYEDGYQMDWITQFSNQLFFYCIRKETDEGEDRFVSVGHEKDLGVATGASNYHEAAIDRAYQAAKGFAMTGVYYRPKSDFMSRDYFTSIMNRYDFLIHSGLI